MLEILCTLLAISCAPEASPVVPVTRPTAASERATMEVLHPLVLKWEGKENVAYFDLVGVPTICSGHTRTVTRQDVLNKRRMSDTECKDLLIAELVEYRRGLHVYFTEETKTKRLPATRDAAFTSLAFNVGIRGAGKSTATRRLNGGDTVGACDALTWWNRAGGRVVRGLVRRRTEEQKLCLVGT